MLSFYPITLFPELITPYCEASILGRAQQQGAIRVIPCNPRDFTTNKHKKVDDVPYGGGAGMVLQCQPLLDAYRYLEATYSLTRENSRVLITTPAGPVFKQAYAKHLSTAEHMVIFCGHYEGFDERIYSLIPHLERVSVGDFVLTGGELAALAIIDAVARLVPGAVGKFESVEADSFYSGNLLDHPHYTRPPVYEGLAVPDVLQSGNHQAIAQWRQQQALEQTRRFRPDLLN